MKVIAEPLLSDEDFQDVQRIMDLKQAKHWRTQPDINHRFTYNGFLTCSACGEVVHTAYARRDYYACKGRRTGHTCTTKYMGREKLESLLDSLFGAHLTSPPFLKRCVAELKRRHAQDVSTAHIQRLPAQVASLREKRTRVVDAFLEGIILREERDSRLTAIDRDILAAQEVLTRNRPGGLIDLNALTRPLPISLSGSIGAVTKNVPYSRRSCPTFGSQTIKSRRSALARQFSAMKISTGARVHSSGQHEAGGEG